MRACDTFGELTSPAGYMFLYFDVKVFGWGVYALHGHVFFIFKLVAKNKAFCTHILGYETPINAVV